MKTTPFQTANECLLHTLSCFSRGLRDNLLISKNKGNWKAGFVYYINRQVSVPKTYVVKFIFCFFKQGFNQNNFCMGFFPNIENLMQEYKHCISPRLFLMKSGHFEGSRTRILSLRMFFYKIFG